MREIGTFLIHVIIVDNNKSLKVYFHSHLGEYRGTIMMVLWVFTPYWMISFFRCFQRNMMPPASVWLNLVQVDVQASKMLEQTYQPTA